MKAEFEQANFAWKLRGDGFLVEVVTWGTATIGAGLSNPTFRAFPSFNAYAYIYPKHPLFAVVSKWGRNDYGGLRVEWDDLPCGIDADYAVAYYDHTGAITSVKFGGDYGHSWDFDKLRLSGIDPYAPITAQEALERKGEPFKDALNWHRILSNMGESE